MMEKNMYGTGVHGEDYTKLVERVIPSPEKVGHRCCAQDGLNTMKQ